MPTPPLTAIRRLALARFISVVGSMAAYTALVDLVYGKTRGSAGWLAATLLLTIGAVGLFEPVGGLVADRVDRKAALIWSDLVGAALFVVLALVGAPWLLLTVALLTAIAETPFRAGSVAAIPNLVQDEALIAKANGWVGVGANLGITVGPALGGLLASRLGDGPVFVLNGASFVVSAVLVWSIRAPFDGVAEDRAIAGEGFAAGFRFLRRDRVLLVVTAAWMVLVLGMGLGLVADRPVAEHFDAGALGFGAILGIWGLGSVVGSWIASKMTADVEPGALVTGFFLAGLGGLGIWLAPAFWMVLACNLLWGAGDALTVVAEQGIIQRRTPDAIRSRVVAANESMVHAALMVGFLLAGPVLASLGPQGTYAVGGIAALGAGMLAAIVFDAARHTAGGKARGRASGPTGP